MSRSFPVSRREVLQWVAAAGVGLHLPDVAHARMRVVDDPFTLGVASGSPTHYSVVPWTRLLLDKQQSLRLSPQPVEVRWEVAHDDSFSRIVQNGSALASAGLAHSVHVEVQPAVRSLVFLPLSAGQCRKRHRPHVHLARARCRGGAAAARLCLLPAMSGQTHLQDNSSSNRSSPPALMATMACSRTAGLAW